MKSTFLFGRGTILFEKDTFLLVKGTSIRKFEKATGLFNTATKAIQPMAFVASVKFQA